MFTSIVRQSCRKTLRSLAAPVRLLQVNSWDEKHGKHGSFEENPLVMTNIANWKMPHRNR